MKPLTFALRSLAQEFKKLTTKKPKTSKIPSTIYTMKGVSPKLARVMHRNFVRATTGPPMDVPEVIKKITDNTIKELTKILSRKRHLRAKRFISPPKRERTNSEISYHQS
jgi:hypothetical protein